MWHVLSRTADGRLHRVAVFASYEGALEYLDQLEEECRPTHRCVERDDRIVVTSYSGDDAAITFIVADGEIDLYEEALS
jgi:6-phosphogluconolactonase (cycloisomerase 2 family)